MPPSPLGEGALQPTQPKKITLPTVCGFLLQAAVSGFSPPSRFPLLVIGGYFKSGGYTMYNTESSDLKRSARFYTPQFSETASVSVRRFAWFLNKPMTEAVEKIIQLLPFIMDSTKVCQACKDSRKCHSCAFNIKKLSEDEQYKILAAL